MSKVEIALIVSNVFWSMFTVYCYYQWGKTLEVTYEVIQAWEDNIKAMKQIDDEMKQSS